MDLWLPLNTKPATRGRLSCCWATDGRLTALRAGSLVGTIGLLGYTATLHCAVRSPLAAAPTDPSCLSPSPGRGRHPKLGFVPASFVTQVAVGDVNSVQRVTRGLANCWRWDGRAKAYILKRCRWYCAHFWRLTPEVLLTTMSGHHLGSVDCWLCQTIHQIFGGGPAGYPRFLRVESAWATSS